MRAVTVKGTGGGGRRRIGPRRDMRMADDFYADLGKVGDGNASRGARDLVRYWRAHRAEVESWLAENPEPKDPEPPPVRKRRRRKA